MEARSTHLVHWDFIMPHPLIAGSFVSKLLSVHAPAMDSSLVWRLPNIGRPHCRLSIAIVLFCTNFLKAAVQGKGNKTHGFPTLITVGRATLIVVQ